MNTPPAVRNTQTALRLALGPGFALGGPSDAVLRTIMCPTPLGPDAVTNHRC